MVFVGLSVGVEHLDGGRTNSVHSQESALVAGIVVVIGKIAFLAALYGFIYTVYRGLVGETRSMTEPARATRGHPPDASVDTWELRPPAATKAPAPEPAAAATIGPPKPPAQPPVAQPTDSPTSPAALTTELTLTPVRDAPAEHQPPTPRPREYTGAALVVLTSPEASLAGGTRVELAQGVTVGRTDDNTVVLRDRFVSSHHAEIIRRDDTYVLRDLGSTNGTFRNGARVEGERVIGEGDRIGIGTTVFVFHDPA